MSDTNERSVASAGSVGWLSFPEHAPPHEVCIEIRLRCGRKFFGSVEGTDGLTGAPVFVIDSRHHPDGEDVPCDEVAAWREHRPTLRFAEREAIERLCEATNDMIDNDKRAGGCFWQDDAAAVAVARGLLERLG